MEFLIVLGSIAVIVLWYFVSKEFQRIAEMKGHAEKRYFWWPFFLSVIGMMMVVALPDRRMIADQKAETVVSDELPDL